MSEKLKKAMDSGSEADMDAYLEVHSAAEIIEDIRAITGMNENLRDQFAGLAMQAVVTGMNTRGEILSDDNRSYIADCCYEISDAMLAARKGGSL